MLMYNLFQYGKKYRKATDSPWDYYWDELNILPADHYSADPITNSASFKYKSIIIGKTPNNDNDNHDTKNVEIISTTKIFK